MTDFGVTPTGFLAKTRDLIRSDYETDLRYEFAKSLPLGDKTALGHIIGILSDSLGKLWEIAEQSFAMMDPDKATLALLRALCLLTGTQARSATSSVVLETLCGDDATLVPAGSVISTDSTGKRFALLADATIVVLPDWVTATPYIADDRVTHSGKCYKCVTAGTSGGTGPTGTIDDETDGTAHWQYLGLGAAAVDTVCASLDSGPIFAAAGDLVAIENPVGGWSTAKNLLDAKLGLADQSDESLRLLREAELARPGKGTPDAVRAALLEVTGVTNVTVFFNNTDETDGDGVLPHSCECLIQGGDDQDLWDALWANVPLGIRTVGTSTGSVIDSQGRTQTLSFTRPAPIPIYVEIHVIKNPRTYPADGAAEIKQSIVTFGDGQATGKDSVSRQVGAQAFSITGVNDVPNCYISTAPSPTLETTIAIGLRQLATYDTTRITVVEMDGTP